MKILCTIDSINPSTGGVAEGTSNSSNELVRLGHEVEIASLDDPAASFAKDFPLTCHALGPGKGFYQYSASYNQWMTENVGRFDCVIIQGIWRYHALAARNACIKNNIPYFVFTHGMLDPWFKQRYPLKHIKKWLFWPWGDYRVLRDARAVLFTTEEERQLASQSFWLYKANERVVGYGIKGVPDGESAQKQAFYKGYPNLKDKPFLLFLSRIHPKKGCDLLIEAFAELSTKYPEWQLVMAGPDQVGLRQGLEALCAKKNVSDKIHWTGMISGDVKWGAFRACDAFVLTSHSENFGIVVPEALSCGTPVLITDKVNIWREVKNDKAGLVETDNQDGATKLLSDFLSLSKTEKNVMREKARTCFQEHFGIEKATDNLLNTIEELL